MHHLAIYSVQYVLLFCYFADQVTIEDFALSFSNTISNLSAKLWQIKMDDKDKEWTKQVNERMKYCLCKTMTLKQ